MIARSRAPVYILPVSRTAPWGASTRATWLTHLTGARVFETVVTALAGESIPVLPVSAGQRAGSPSTVYTPGKDDSLQREKRNWLPRIAG
jgi:hypothetical protein